MKFKRNADGSLVLDADGNPIPPEAALAAEGVHAGVGEGDAQADDACDEGVVGGEQHRGRAGEVARLVDDGAPELAGLPEAVVRGVGAKHQQEAEGGADEGVHLLGRLELMPAVVHEGEKRCGRGAHERAEADGPGHGAAGVEEMVAPAVGFVVDHGRDSTQPFS